MCVPVLDPPAGLHGQILTTLIRSGPRSRLELAEAANVNASTIARAVPELTSTGWVREADDRSPARGRGRPGKRVSVRQEHHLAVGLKIGPERLVGAVTDLTGTMIVAEHRPTGPLDPGLALGAAGQLVRQLTARGLAQVADPEARIVGLGIGVGGHVVEGRLVATSHILGWRHVDVSGVMGGATGLPTITLNDVTALAAGEHWFGEGRRVDDLAVVTIGRGLGCGLVLGGRVHRGATGSAGELGHLPLVPDGPLCGCGNRGCLEALVSDRGVVTALRARRGDEQVRELADVLRLARGGDRSALDCLATAGAWLGRGVAAVVNLANPALVIIAGEMVAAMDFMESDLRRAAAAHTFSSSWDDSQLLVDRGGEELWARGAAGLAIRAAVKNPARMLRQSRVAG